jgi:hypothetical protein
MAYLCDKCAFIYRRNGKLVIVQSPLPAHACQQNWNLLPFFLSTETYTGAQGNRANKLVAISVMILSKDSTDQNPEVLFFHCHMELNL